MLEILTLSYKIWFNAGFYQQIYSLNSDGSECLPYKQNVVGSKPTGNTKDCSAKYNHNIALITDI